MSIPSIFWTDERTYVIEPMGDGNYAFNYTTNPYSRTGRRPSASGQIIMSAEEAEAFIKRNR